jgi:ParB-like chromosome segregation protein Spo0J
MTPKGPPFAVRYVPIVDVKENPDNPRSISVDQFRRLVASVREFPQMLDIRPLVVDADMVVLGGNMRLKACREAGLTAVPVVIADTLTPDQRREFIIKDNASFGAWDWDALANEWSDLPLADWGVDLGVIPDFKPADITEQGALDSIREKRCPSCNEIIP